MTAQHYARQYLRTKQISTVGGKHQTDMSTVAVELGGPTEAYASP